MNLRSPFLHYASLPHLCPRHPNTHPTAPNLIKGFRYELFTRVRAIPTVSCVVFCDTPYETAAARNAQLQRYQERIFEDLWNRLEEPLAAFRWDAPLFTVKPDEPVPVQAIVEVRAASTSPPSHHAT